AYQFLWGETGEEESHRDNNQCSTSNGGEADKEADKGSNQDRNDRAIALLPAICNWLLRSIRFVCGNCFIPQRLLFAQLQISLLYAAHDIGFQDQQDSNQYEGETDGMKNNVVHEVPIVFADELHEADTDHGSRNTATGEPKGHLEIHIFLPDMHYGTERFGHGRVRKIGADSP